MGKYDDKTEKATPKRRRDARREGTVARSQEVATATSLFAALLTIRVLGAHGIRLAATETRGLLGTPLTDGTLPSARIGSSVVRLLLGLAGPFLAATFVVALVAGFAQVGFHAAPKALKPKLSNISPKKGLQKFSPAMAGWELTRTALKLGLLAAVVWTPLVGWSADADRARSLDEGLADLLGQVWTVLVRAMLLAVLIAGADYAWNRYRTEKQLKMSKQDLKQEHKDSEGDPHVRAQRRRRMLDLSRNRMLGAVSTADVVVTNPTHLAVALRYGAGDAAPRVVAKGADRLAMRIRREAGRHGVPITENKPLARALYRQVKVDGYVPGALYEAVAVVLAVAYRRSGRLPAGLLAEARA